MFLTQKRVVVATLLPMLAVAPAGAQRTGQCDASPGGVVLGSVRNAETGAPVAERGVLLMSEDHFCTGITDQAGRFLITGIPPGSYELRAGDLGFRRQKPVPVTLEGQDTVRMNIRLRPGDHLDDCRDAPHCAAWLEAEAPPGWSEEEAFELAALRTAAILSWKDMDEPMDWYFCFDATHQRVAEAFTELHAATAPARECALDREEEDEAGRRLRHLPTGEPAYGLMIEGELPSSSPDQRQVQLSHYVAPLWAEGWTCRFTRTAGDWEPVSCRMDWIS